MWDSDGDDDWEYSGNDDDYYDDYDDEYMFVDDALDFDLRRRPVASPPEISDDSDGETSVQSRLQVPSLVDISSRFVALKFPFAYIEHRNPPVPDELQLKVISFSFPDNEEIVRKYAEFSGRSVDNYTIQSARRLCKTGCVKNLTQIGFRLSATTTEGKGDMLSGRYGHGGKNYVVIHFDRGKITSALCSCNSKTSWCHHVVATAFKRIASKQDTAKVCIRLPLSDSLNLLNREQLLKFAQYLLCEHKNEPIVDSAQELLDKLLCHGGTQNEEDDINTVPGAPDPTAGPGMDETVHWCVSKKGFKEKCENIGHTEIEVLGIGVAASKDSHRYSVQELWQNSLRHPTMIKDVIDQQLDLEGRYYFSSTHQTKVLQVLETVSDLLRDETMSAIEALQACTEIVVSKVDSQSKYNRQRAEIVGIADIETRTLSDGGFTPQPFSCRTVISAVSRLWRIAVLDPKMSLKNRQLILQQITTWDKKVKMSCHEGNFCVWQGLEVALRLGQLYHQNAEVAAIMKRPCLAVPAAISSCMAVHFRKGAKPMRRLQASTKEAPGDDEEMQDVSDNTSTPSSVPSPSQQVPQPPTFLFPHHVSFSPTCTLDVHTVCSIVEALDLYGNSRGSVSLAVGLSVSIVSFYERVIQQGMDSSELPVSGTCFFAGGKVVEAQGSGEDIAGSSSIWPVDTLLTVMTFAFLFDVLSKHSSDADAIVMKMSSGRMKSSKSLMFQLGLCGLYVPKIPVPTKQQEVGQYECESWLTSQLIKMIPSDQDKELLSSFGHCILRSSVLCHAAPPSSLARVIFHHLFVEAPPTFDVSLTAAQSLGLDVAFHVLRSVNVQDERSESWCFFQYSLCRLWSKLAEAVLRCLSDNKPLLDKAMSCILSQEGLLALGAMSRESGEEESSLRPSTRLPLLIEVECRVAYALGRVVAGKRDENDQLDSVINSRRIYIDGQMADHKAEKVTRSASERALALCAIQLGAHSLWLQKGRKVNTSYSRSDISRQGIISWLTELALSLGNEGIECFLQCKEGVATFLDASEALTFCGKLCRRDGSRRFAAYEMPYRIRDPATKGSSQKDEQQRRIFTQIVLTSLLDNGTGSADETRRIFTFCREQTHKDRAVLVPWICHQLKTKSLTKTVQPQALMEASKALFQFFQETPQVQQIRRSRDPFEDDDVGLRLLYKQDEEEHAEAGAEGVNQNVTPEPSPHLELAFQLGLQALASLNEDERQEKSFYRHSGMQDYLRNFCEIVICLVSQKWKVTEGYLASQPDEEGVAAGASDVQKTPSNRHLSQFVSQLINSVRNPMWLFDVLTTLCTRLSGDQRLRTHMYSSSEERQNEQIRNVCTKYPSLRLLSQKNLVAFSDLLLGPKIVELIEDLNNRAGWRGEVSVRELQYATLEGARFIDVLKITKRLCLISDSSGTSFENLAREMEAKHPVLKPVFVKLSKDEPESLSDEEREIVVPRHLWPLFAGNLHPFLARRNPLELLFFD